ncbi:hypothetical protein ARAF_2645 [Arsenophonus endosymbiont of Aleurodicus floccissimus]|uniref:hypothetical protein n=1 Tax=Arsenophonus endosymbiont of Aleurodicus floccissimus TaxID=2152761 RepID=UPI000ED570E2|nr:hypothetical protein [Arsenophonus endosymbiont of Aleurodicus floccissimus]SPP32480.1 hypothetical protein ARAF_2645 [Arsenophonus endosymbiont of Aleurodicus floccissimus]
MNEILFKNEDDINLINQRRVAIIAQLIREMDEVRAREFWRSTLPSVPPEILAEALTVGISSWCIIACPTSIIVKIIHHERST